MSRTAKRVSKRPARHQVSMSDDLNKLIVDVSVEHDMSISSVLASAVQHGIHQAIAGLRPPEDAGFDVHPGTSQISKRDFQKTLSKFDNDVDLILTDPPYAISKETGFANVKTGEQRFAVSMDFGEWDHQEIDLDAFCSASYKALRKGGTAIVWYDLWKLGTLANAMAKAGFKMLRLIVWHKTNPVPLNSKVAYLSNAREIAVFGVKEGKPTFNSAYHSGEYRYPIARCGRGEARHPTEKPLGLFRELIANHSNAGDLVVDPFLGSGTTAEAAVAQGRNFVGGDLNPNYCDRARRRAAAAKSILTEAA